MGLLIIGFLVVVLILLLYFNNSKKTKIVTLDPVPLKLVQGSFRIPDVAMTDLDMDGSEYAKQLDLLGDFLFAHYKDVAFVKKTISEVKDSMKSPQLILIQLQNNVERHKMEDLEECLTE